MSSSLLPTQLHLPVSARDHVAGPDDAIVTLVEYGDYECPYCGRAYPIVRAIQQRLGDRLRFVFRNFPVTSAHPHAQHAAEAAEAVASLGRFWDMHDTLFEHQRALSDDRLTVYAASVGVDIYQFRHDLTHHTFAPRVREDFMSGVRSGVNGTPTFFINGRRYDGPWDFGNLLRVLEEWGETSAHGSAIEREAVGNGNGRQSRS